MKDENKNPNQKPKQGKRNRNTQRSNQRSEVRKRSSKRKPQRTGIHNKQNKTDSINLKPQKENYNDYFTGKLPKGCALCREGSKVVIFFGGECTHPEHCRWYCPISEERRNPSAYFVDELVYDSEATLFEEIKAIDAKGASFTGGEPLITLEKTKRISEIIKSLKIKKSKEFHIHLYTTGVGFSVEKAQMLFEAGLDEIRFHPPLNDFSSIEIALQFGWVVGAEVPAIPDTQHLDYVKRLAEFLKSHGGKFLNLNEFEIVDSNYKLVEEKGFRLQKDRMANVEHSRKMYMPLLKELSSPNFSVHFCTVENKDSNQFKMRYSRRANTIKRPYEMVTEDGLLYFLRLMGSPESIKMFIEELEDDSGVPREMIGKDGLPNSIDLPFFLSENKDFLEMVREYGLDGGLIEGLPFRGPNFQICEYVPLFYFMDEDDE